MACSLRPIGTRPHPPLDLGQQLRLGIALATQRLSAPAAWRMALWHEMLRARRQHGSLRRALEAATERRAAP